MLDSRLAFPISHSQSIALTHLMWEHIVGGCHLSRRWTRRWWWWWGCSYLCVGCTVHIYSHILVIFCIKKDIWGSIWQTDSEATRVVCIETALRGYVYTAKQHNIAVIIIVIITFIFIIFKGSAMRTLPNNIMNCSQRPLDTHKWSSSLEHGGASVEPGAAPNWSPMEPGAGPGGQGLQCSKGSRALSGSKDLIWLQGPVWLWTRFATLLYLARQVIILTLGAWSWWWYDCHHHYFRDQKPS